ncbi:uncharacterized protein K489DRAFT_385393 [Dissoconium aciculare CBS 342.82]|uniref:Transcriptional regulator n=1 Tax=Dissoconium aciculare CBS 342.82 TaxID=1314786 RepID=A0A6J3LRK0_9PEZI|nr:uncharacterized protein K489DRAFT_385393 [Dissoconium aciculare CBS 342.82]KAF1817904.1 hypothetical protein K489DRAFT_385393 [Dissoconium aciculare CBS 342.82]
MPSDADLTRCLQRTVRDALRQSQDITVNLARRRVEEELDLEAGFFKEDVRWKAKSKEVIQEAFSAAEKEGEEEDGQEEDQEEREAEVELPSRRTKPGKAKLKEEIPQPKKKKEEEKVVVGEKRKASGVGSAARKRRKAAVVDSDDDEVDEEEEEEHDQQDDNSNADSDDAFEDSGKEIIDEDEDVIDVQPHQAKSRTKVVEDDDDDDKSSLSDPPDRDSSIEVSKNKKEEAENDDQNDKNDNDNDDESDMSILNDSPPPAKKKKRTTTNKPPKPKPSAATTKPTSKSDALSPTEAEIKRLQSQLAQCGHRKQWHRELAPFATSNEKVRHLKSLLADIGIKGRFSADKARAIKEARELEEEIQAAREFERRWGAAGDEDEEEEDDGEGSEDEGNGARSSRAKKGDDNVPPRQRRGVLPKGLVDFGDSGDEASD